MSERLTITPIEKINPKLLKPLEILRDYNGELTITKDSIKLTSENVITGYYNTGEIWKQKKVTCIIEVSIFLGELHLIAEENTYEILGGYSGSYTEEMLLGYLKQYNFEEKTHQYSLFEGMI